VGVAPSIIVDDAGEDNIFNARVFHGDRLLEHLRPTEGEAEVDACLNAWNVVTVKEALCLISVKHKHHL
jgi:hypothetical protein